MEEVFVHNSDGDLISLFDTPGTNVKRKDNLPYNVHTHFPVGEIKTITSPCGKMNPRQDPEREYCHVEVTVPIITRGETITYCFHPYRDTLEIVE